MSTRRDFLRAGIAGAAGIVLADSAPAWAQTATDARIEVLLGEPIAAISPNVYGQFAENLGGVVYDGIWVGETSPVPNVGGVRKALVDHLRAIKAPLMRFPGGCYADSYDWRDGVGPPAERPRRTNFWVDEESGAAPPAQKFDPNRFGTDEFMRFCRLAGCAPYLAANVRSLPGLVFDEWVEYCNAPAGSTTFADERAAAGDAEPFAVRYWGVGKEAWGCGGTFTPQEYAEEFCRYTAAVPDFGVDLRFVAAGPDKGDWQWTRGFFEAIARRGKGQLGVVYAFALHDYTWNLSRGKTTDWVRGKGDAVAFAPVDWYELLREGSRMESLITEHWKLMGDVDTAHVVKLAVDEWASWYRPGSAPTPGDLFEQMPTLRDAVYSALTLDIFNRHADKVAMANCAQLVNCLNSPYLAHEDKFCVTPVGHVFALYAAHQGGQSVRAEFSAPDVAYDRDGMPASFRGLDGSASLRGKTLTLTVVNPHVSEPRSTRIVVRDAAIAATTVTTLTAPDIHAHNTFDRPDAVVPASRRTDVAARAASIVLPPASVTQLTLSLA